MIVLLYGLPLSVPTADPNLVRCRTWPESSFFWLILILFFLSLSPAPLCVSLVLLLLFFLFLLLSFVALCLSVCLFRHMCFSLALSVFLVCFSPVLLSLCLSLSLFVSALFYSLCCSSLCVFRCRRRTMRRRWPPATARQQRTPSCHLPQRRAWTVASQTPWRSSSLPTSPFRKTWGDTTTSASPQRKAPTKVRVAPTNEARIPPERRWRRQATR